MNLAEGFFYMNETIIKLEANNFCLANTDNVIYIFLLMYLLFVSHGYIELLYFQKVF